MLYMHITQIKLFFVVSHHTKSYILGLNLQEKSFVADKKTAPHTISIGHTALWLHHYLWV